MSEMTLSIDGVQVPRFLYGTAWKEDQTQRLTELALRAGFRGIDTANQRRHYFEAAVGQAVAALAASGIVDPAPPPLRGRGVGGEGETAAPHPTPLPRGESGGNELFLQTKFTFRPSHDERLPYDPAAPIATQVEQSFASSLEHLGVAAIDSYLLHGPTQRQGLAMADWEACARSKPSTRAAGLASWASATSPSNSSSACATRHGFHRASCRTAAMPSRAGTVPSAGSVRPTDWSTRAFLCSPPTVPSWPIPTWSASPSVMGGASPRLSSGSRLIRA